MTWSPQGLPASAGSRPVARLRAGGNLFSDASARFEKKQGGRAPLLPFFIPETLAYSSSPSSSEAQPIPPPPKPPEKLGAGVGVKEVGAGAGAAGWGVASAAILGAASFLGAAFLAFATAFFRGAANPYKLAVDPVGAAFLAFFTAFFRGAAFRFMPDLRADALLRMGFRTIFLRDFAAFFFARFLAKLPPPFIPEPGAGRVATGRPKGL